MRAIYICLLAAALPLAAVSPVNAQPGNEEDGFFGGIWESTKDIFGVGDEDRRRSRVFTEEEREIFRDFFGDREFRGARQKPLPPGLKKKVARGGQLPPGWQKKVARGEVLPEDVYRYRVGFPDDLWRRLPAPPQNTDTFRVEDRVIRVINGTREIVDILDL